MQRKYLVYMHRNKINNKVYIGQTSQFPEARWGKNGSCYKGSPHFFHAIKKYGWENFQHIIIKTKLTAKEADQLEMQLIKEYNSTDQNHGYNIRIGGEHGFIYSEEQKKNLSAILKENSHNRKDARKIYCKETKDVFGTISDAQRWANTTHIHEVLNGQRHYAGRHPITGQKLSWKQADKDANITKICKEKVETSFRQLGAHQVQIICVNTGQIFLSMREAADWCGLKDTANISRCCRGLRKTAGTHPQTQERLKWKYVNEDNKKELTWA